MLVNALLRSILFLLVAASAAADGGRGERGEPAGHERGYEGGYEGGYLGGYLDGRLGGYSGWALNSWVPFISDGRSHGIFESLILMQDESYAGLLGDTEIAVRYDPVRRTFIGRVRNEASQAVCDVRPVVELDGWMRIAGGAPGGNDYTIDGLRPYDRAEFEFALGEDTVFEDWVVQIETSGCSSAPAGTGGGGEGSEGGEGAGERGGGEAGGEHGSGGEGGNEGGNEGGREGGSEGGGEGREGGEGCGGGDGGEDDPTIPIMEVASGTFGSAEYSFLFDMADMAFRGTVHNPTARPICRSRTEIHMGIGGTQTIELGPTMPVDLMPGETLKVVMTAPDYMPDTHAVHPESSQCP